MPQNPCGRGHCLGVSARAYFLTTFLGFAFARAFALVFGLALALAFGLALLALRAGATFLLMSLAGAAVAVGVTDGAVCP